jgi:hypothetical protein
MLDDEPPIPAPGPLDQVIELATRAQRDCINFVVGR